MKNILALLLSLFSSLSVLAAEPLKVGIFPRYTQNETSRLFEPLMAQLSRNLKRPVELITSPDFPAFWQKVQSHAFDLLHYNQYHYVKAAQQFGHRVLVCNEEFGRQQLRATIVVPQESPLTEITQLRDHKILFGGGRAAMVSYIMPTDLLQQAGLKPSEYVHQIAQTPHSAVTALYYQQGDAASASDVILQRDDLPWKHGGKDLRALAVSEPIAHLPWAVAAHVPEREAQHIRQTLLTLNELPGGRLALHQAQLTGLIAVDDDDYDLARKIIARVLKQNY